MEISVNADTIRSHIKGFQAVYFLSSFFQQFGPKSAILLVPTTVSLTLSAAPPSSSLPRCTRSRFEPLLMASPPLRARSAHCYQLSFTTTFLTVPDFGSVSPAATLVPLVLIQETSLLVWFRRLDRHLDLYPRHDRPRSARARSLLVVCSRRPSA